MSTILWGKCGCLHAALNVGLGAAISPDPDEALAHLGGEGLAAGPAVLAGILLSLLVRMPNLQPYIHIVPMTLSVLRPGCSGRDTAQPTFQNAQSAAIH